MPSQPATKATQPPQPVIPPRHCAFILDDGPWKGGKKPIWCDQPPKYGSVYCDKHHRICHHRI